MLIIKPMYKAKIIESSLSAGKLTVRILYYIDGGDSFTDTISSTQEQKREWIDESIQRRLKSLNQLPDVVDYADSKKELPIEQVQEVAGTEQTELDRAEYKADLEQFERYIRALTKGMTDEQNANFIALKQKLKDNFKDEYLDMF